MSASRARRAAWYIVLALAALAACAKPAPPGLAVKRQPADIAFGIKPQPATPAGLAPPSLEEDIRPDAGVGASAPPQVTRTECGQAGPNDFPQEAAPLEVSGRPKQGVYAWKLAGYNQQPGLPRIPLGNFAERAVQEVRSDSGAPDNFTFQTVERDLHLGSRRFVTSGFHVDLTNSNTRLRGIYLIRVTSDVRDGRTPPSTFIPNPPILYLRTPVLSGEESAWRSVGVDTSPFQTMAHEAYVKGRHRVDACGTVIDAWLIDASQTVTTSSGTSRRDYNYAIATQFGGLIFFEHSESPCTQSVEDQCQPPGQLYYETNVAKTEPDSARKDIR